MKLLGLLLTLLAALGHTETCTQDQFPNSFEYAHDVVQRLVDLVQFKNESDDKVASLEMQLAALNSSNPPTRSSTYIHWGLSTCPNVTSTTLVYKGQAAGGHFTHKGSGQYVCIPCDPQYDKYNATEENATRSLIYGAEYETIDSPVLSSLNQFDVPCAVCLGEGKTTLMVPGRTSCYSGWTMEYQGYLMGEQHTNHGKGYVCMDKNAEPMSSSFPNIDGALFYTVEGRCGSLKCPPYVDGRELPCVVCSKTV